MPSSWPIVIDAGAADAGDHDAPGVLGQRQLRLGDRGQRVRVGALGLLLRLLQLPAFDGDEARAEALQAGVVLVAGVLVDAALAAELGLDRLHAQAVALHAAVAAAFADQLVDHHALGRVDHRAALAAAPLLGGAGLVVDQDRAAFDLAQLALHRVELVAVVHRRRRAPGRPARRTCRARRSRPRCAWRLRPRSSRVICGTVQHAVDRLAAGHRDRVVEQDLVGDVDARPRSPGGSRESPSGSRCRRRGWRTCAAAW